MSAALQIRFLQRQDAEQVAALTSQLGYERSAGQIQAWIDTYDPAMQAVFVACRDQQVLGWIEVSVVAHLQSDRHTLIGGLVVKEGTRGLGIGRLLCEEAERWSVARNIDTIRVTSRSTRTDAHRFYLRDGYSIVKTSAVFEKSLRDSRSG